MNRETAALKTEVNNLITALNTTYERSRHRKNRAQGTEKAIKTYKPEPAGDSIEELEQMVAVI